MSKVVGMSLKTKKEWLNAALDQLIQNNDETNIRIFLDEYIKEDLPGKQYRDKVLGIVQRIWINIPDERSEIRRRAIELAQRIPAEERIWLHWGMAILAYPFFRDSVQVIGRLTLLQNSIQTNQIHARLLGLWGDRVTTKDAVQRLMTTLVDWEIIQLTLVKGEFALAAKRKAGPDVQLWLLHALSIAGQGSEVELQQLLRMPEVFPFMINIEPANIRKYDAFDVHRQGVDMEMVALHPVNLSKTNFRLELKKPEESDSPVSKKANDDESSQLTLFYSGNAVRKEPNGR